MNAYNNSNTRAYDVIADRILNLLDKGEVPWRKPWSLQPGARPQNAVSKRPVMDVNYYGRRTTITLAGSPPVFADLGRCLGVVAVRLPCGSSVRRTRG